MTNPNNPKNLPVYSYVNAQGETIYGYVVSSGHVTVEVNADNTNRKANVNPDYQYNFPSTYTGGYPALTLRESFDQPFYVNQNGVGLSTINQAIADGSATSAFDFAMKNLINGYYLNRNVALTNYLTDRPVVNAQILDGTPPSTGIGKIWPSKELQYAIWGETDALNPGAAADFLHSVYTANTVLVESSTAIATYSSLPSYTFSASTDNYTAPYAARFIASAANIDTADVVDGTNAVLSSITITAGANTVGAATLKNIGTYNVAYTGGGFTIDAKNYSGITSLGFSGSNAGTFANLAVIPPISIKGASAYTTSFVSDALTGAPTAYINVAGTTTGAGIVLNVVTTGNLGKVSINSTGSAANALALSGNALTNTFTEIDVNSEASAVATVTVGSGVTTVNKVTGTGAGASAVVFSDTTTGSTSHPVTANFSTARSSITFTGVTYANAAGSANSLNFVGTGNNLGLTYAAANALGSTPITATNLTSLELITAGTGTVNLAIFGSLLNTVNVDLASATLTLNNPQNGTTINLGKAGAAVTANTLVVTPTINSSLNINMLGTGASVTEALTLNSITSANFSTASTIASGTVTFTLTAAALTTVTVKGGNAAATVAFGNLPATTTMFDASASLSAITATSQVASTVSGTLKGSLTAASDLVGAAGNDIMIGGTANDKFDGKAGTNTMTFHNSGSTESNTAIFTAAGGGVTTITDFIPGTDVVDLHNDMTTTGFTGFLIGAGTAATAVAFGSTYTVKTVAALSSGVTLLATDGLILTTHAYATSSALLTDIQAGHVTATGNYASATKGLPVLWLDSTATPVAHLGVITVGTNAAAVSTAETYVELAAFSNITTEAELATLGVAASFSFANIS